MHGHAEPKFEAMRTAFAKVLAEHAGGMNVAVYEDGREVVNLWGGANQKTGERFTSDSLVLTASCTKAVTAICALMLAERGDLDLDAPVGEYWPQFATRGKADIPVRWLLTHQAGLPLFAADADIRPADMLDWDKITAALADQSPMWEPGAFCGYHAVTFGYLVGEVIRRVSGQSVGDFLARNVTGPLGADFWIGLPEQQEPRVSPSVSSSAPAVDADSLKHLYEARGLDLDTALARAMLAPPRGDGGPGDPVWNTRPFHAAEIPAVNGIGTAGALARIYAACIGEVDGIRLLSPATIESARTPQTDHVPTPPEFRVFTDAPPRFGLGFQLPHPAIIPMLGPGSFGHSGAGGRLALAHPERGIAFGFTCDNMLWDGLNGPDQRWTPLLAALAEPLAR